MVPHSAYHEWLAAINKRLRRGPPNDTLARRLVQVVDADDVGLQDGRPGLPGGYTAQVHHGAHALQQGLRSNENHTVRPPCTAFPNRFRQALLVGQTQIGCWVSLGSPITTEVLGVAGFDWLR